MRSIPLALFAALALASCKSKPIFVETDAGPLCEDNLELVNGTCMFVCHRDGDCMAGERCNLFSGQCEMKPPPPDAGPPPPMCTAGATRCTADKKGIETCEDTGTWMTTMTCPPPNGFCQDEKCLVCQPGVTTCDATDMTKLDVCKDDGSGVDVITCTSPATCQSNECRACAPNTYRCSPDGKSLQQCSKGSDITQTWTWTNIGDNFDGTCITGQCVVGGANGYQCVAPQCFPGQIQCKDMSTAQSCGMNGAWVDQPCTGTTQCQAGICVDECADAVNAKSYFGCDYWTTVLDNSVDPLFKGGVLTGQGAAGQTSEFAFVVANRSISPATVTITRYYNGTFETLPTVNVPGRNDAATKGVAVIRVPWQSISPDSNQVGISNSGKARYGYRLQSTKPLTVYQFNPLGAYIDSGSCNNANQCNATTQPDPNVQCNNRVCRYFAYSNDASLLLPAHILGTSYVTMTPDHAVYRPSGVTSNATQPPISNGAITIVATQDNTTVTIKASAKTTAGTLGSVAAINRGQSVVFSGLNSYDVLQVASDDPTDPVAPALNLPNSALGCGLNEFSALYPFNNDYFCRTDTADLSGSVITADKPIAVFGSSACTQFGPGDAACDKVEEMQFPFVTWGTNFVAVRSAPLRLTTGSFASTANAGPDYYKIVAGCPATTCPAGTLVQLHGAGTVVDADLSPSHCVSGSLAGNNCRIAGGNYIEFRSKTSFTITADQPVAVGQFFAGENATTGTTTAAEGDPSFIMLPPVEQWRTNYTILTAPGIKDNYLGLVMDATRVQSVTIDGTAVNGWVALTGTSFQTVNAPVSNGTHVVQVVPKATQPPLPDGGVYNQQPGAGVTVYGFDSYVSYGYTGGLDLQSIVTGINPGG
jgi:hypothetical protein